MELAPKFKEGDIVYVIPSKCLESMRMSDFVGYKGIISVTNYKKKGTSGCWVDFNSEKHNGEWWIPLESLFKLS